MSAPIYWPEDVLPFRSVMFARRSLSRSGGMSVTGIEQVVQSATDYWVATVGVKIHRAEQILAYRALQAQNWGRSGSWVIPACSQRGLPKGSDFSLDDFSPDFFTGEVVASTNAPALLGATTLLIHSTFAPVAGMFFSIGERLYLVGTVTSGGSGNYTITFAPKLRTAVAASVSVEFTHPVCLMRLAEDNAGQMDLDMLRFADISLSFVEVPP